MVAARGFVVSCTAPLLTVAPTALAGTHDTEQSGPRPPNGTPQRIDAYAPYQPQTTCRPRAREGTRRFAHRMLRHYGRGHHIATSQPCGSGTSEHYDGRAWDWGLNVRRAPHRRAAHDFLHWLFEPDRHGRVAAKARRLGVMYVIWNRRIWSSYRHSEGWRPYTGSNPHTDHIHVSLSWPGARANTSYWTGRVS